MADNLFKDSDPNCGVPEVPVVDFKFVDDCFIEPTPPPIFECVLPPVPNEPCIKCPEFDGGGTINVGYPDSGEGCPKEPRIDVRVEKKGDDPCQYDFKVDVDIPIPRPPCPEINVNSFEVQSRFNSPGCCSDYNADITVDTVAARDALPAADIVQNVIVYTAGSDQFWINDGSQTEPNWRELVPTDSAEACQNTFTITPRHREPVDCNDPGECAFDIDLKITVPIPRIPCPTINVTNFEAKSHWDRSECCAQQTVGTVAELNALSAEEAPVGTYIATSLPKQVWRRTESGWNAVPDPCENSFTITTVHRPPVDCNDPGECRFDIDLKINIPIPPIPCPTINGRNETHIGYDNTPCVDCISDLTVRNYNALNTIQTPPRKDGMYVAVTEVADKYTLSGDLTTWTPSGFQRQVRSTAELAAIPLNERSGVTVTLVQPPELYELDGNRNWQPIYAPVADFTVSSFGERNALSETVAPKNSIVKIADGNTITFWQRGDNNNWSAVDNPTPNQTVANFDALLGLDVSGPSGDAQPGDVVKLNEKPDRFQFVGGAWLPTTEAENITVVYDEASLQALPQDERTAGMLVKVQQPTDRYQLTGTVWKPARCPKNQFAISARKKKAKNCDEADECNFDIVLELVVPIPKPPCPEINVNNFTVTSSFAGDDCTDCKSDITAETYEAAAGALAGKKIGATAIITNPVTRYILGANLTTWSPVENKEPITVTTDTDLAALLQSGYNGQPLTPGQQITVASPDTLYKLSSDLVSWVPERVITNVPPTKLVTVETAAALQKVDFSQRFAGLYARVLNPITNYTVAPGSTLQATSPDVEVSTIQDRDAIPPENRKAGMFVTITDPVTRIRKVGANEVAPDPCPKNQFVVRKRTEKSEDCNTPDQCEFDIDLEILVPIPRIPCPIINIAKFKVDTHFVGGEHDDECCEPESQTPVIEVPNAAALDELSFEAAPAGSYAKTTDDGKFWLRTHDEAEDIWDWVEEDDPNGPTCKNRFRIRPKHRKPENCEDPGQCEFDIELQIDVPIPRIPCPTVTTTFTTTIGYDDDPCINCDSDIEVNSFEDLANVPEEEQFDGMRAKIKNPVTKYMWDGENWVPAETDTSSEPDKTVNSFNDLTSADATDGNVVDIENPPTQFYIGNGAQTAAGKFVYQWEPLTDIVCENAITFNSAAERDLHFSTNYAGWHSACVTVTNPPSRYKYSSAPLGGTSGGGLPAGWVGIGGGEIAVDDTVANPDELPEDAAPGDIVEVIAPVNRYKLSDGAWVPDSCPVSRFTITPRHKPGDDCKDPGQCEFDVVLDIVVPIPKPPCPEINATPPGVRVASSACLAEEEPPGSAVDTTCDLYDMPLAQRAAGMVVQVAETGAVYKLSDDLATWEPSIRANRFTITTRHESNKVKKVVKSIAERDDLTNIKYGEIVAVAEEDQKTYWRRGDCVHAPKWSEIEFSEDCDPDEEREPAKCIFDIDIEILVPLPPCPDFKARVYTNYVYEELIEDCCPAQLKFDSLSSLLALGPFGNGKPLVITTVNGVPSFTPPPEGITASVKSGDNKTRWRWITQEGGWRPSKCESYVAVSPRPQPEDCEDRKCEFDVVIDILVPIPKPPCPEFTTNISTGAFYGTDEEPCTDCPSILKFDEMTELTDIGPIGDGRPRVWDINFVFPPEGITARVKQNKTRWRWLTDEGGWRDAPCTSYFSIRPRSNDDCDETTCEFDILLDIVVPVPQPPCPVFNTRTNSVTFCTEDQYPRSQATITQREQPCSPDEFDQPKGCIFDFDFQLEIPCPLMFGGFISVTPGPPGGGGGWLMVNQACGEAQPNPDNMCPPANHFANDIVDRDRQVYTAAKNKQPIQVGSVFKLQQPRPFGSYWRYWGGVENFSLQWQEIFCDPPEIKPVCGFEFGASIVVPYCEPKFSEDDDDGFHTGIPKADRFKIYYIKPTEKCPAGKEPECPKADREVDDIEARDALLGEAPGIVDAIDHEGAPFPLTLTPGLKFKVIGDDTKVYRLSGRVGDKCPNLPLNVFSSGCRPGTCPEGLPKFAPGAWVGKLGKGAQIGNGAIVKVKENYYKLVVPGGKVCISEPGNHGWILVPCEDKSSSTFVIAPEKNRQNGQPIPCKYRYAVKTIICNRQPDNIASCTKYYGDPCCDTGCPCTMEKCCEEGDENDSNSKEAQPDGSKDIGNKFYKLEPNSPGYTEEFRTWPQDEQVAVPADLPRAEAQACDECEKNAGLASPINAVGDMAPADRPVMYAAAPGEEAAFFDPANDPCIKAAVDMTGCTQVPYGAISDKGYRPYKFLELRIREEFPPDRLTPPKVKHNIEAAMNCLHGGVVRVRKAGASGGGGGATGPTSPFQMPPEDGVMPVDNPIMAYTVPSPSTELDEKEDDLGSGKVIIEQNRVNVVITLKTKECPTTGASGPTGGGDGSNGSGYMRMPPPYSAIDNPILALNGGNSDLSPALLESLIRAINTNPELKAAIRQVVNQPD